MENRQKYGPVQFATGLFWIGVPSAKEGDTISVELGMSEPRVLLNGKEAEYVVWCEHERDMMGCPACFTRATEGNALGHSGEGSPWRTTSGLLPPEGV